MKRFQKWQKLNQYFEQGVFTFIDLAFAETVLRKLYRNNLKNRNFGKEAPQNFDSERAPIAEKQGASENQKSEERPTPSKTDSSSCFGIHSEKEEHAALLAVLFALCRQGHLTLDLSEEGLCVALQLLSVVDRDALKELLHLGASTFPSQGIAEVNNCEDYPHAWICRMGACYYLQKNWVYESKILKHIERLNQHAPAVPLTLYPDRGTPQTDSRLNKAQKKAIENAIVNSLSLLTGGPGTGKTFTAAELVKICLNSTPTNSGEQMRIILTAPTGKAVSQLEGNLKSVLGSETAIRAGTLHAVLGIRAQTYEEEDRHPLFADLIIVDECSMIDAKIFSQLLSKVPNGARLVLIGDKDQLPPVEAGSIFADLLEANVYPSVSLSECLRSDRSEILALSHHIKQGSATSALELLNQGATTFWVDLEKSEKTSMQLCADLWDQYSKYFLSYSFQKPLPEHIYDSLWRFGLLSSMRKSDLGVDAINRYFLHQSIKKTPQGSWAIFPIMITRNDYELKIYNGDLGFLVRKLTPGFSLRQFELEDYILLCDRKSGLRQIAALRLCPSFPIQLLHLGA